MTERRFEELEKRVKHLQKKRLVARVLIVFILFLAGAFLWWYFYGEKLSGLAQESLDKNTPSKKELKVQDTAPKEKTKSFKPITTQKSEDKDTNESIKSKKALETNTTKKEDLAPYDTIFLSPSITTEIENTQKEVKPKIEVSEKKPQEKQEQNQEVNFSMQVKEVKNKEALQERFEGARDYESAIALSKLFFEEQSFNKTLHWAKIASKIKPSAAEPWILFAKAKEAQGDIESAKKALSLYLEYFNDQEAQNLLKNLEEVR